VYSETPTIGRIDQEMLNTVINETLRMHLFLLSVKLLNGLQMTKYLLEEQIQSSSFTIARTYRSIDIIVNVYVTAKLVNMMQNPKKTHTGRVYTKLQHE
jgi:hypothetical protein